MAPAYSMDLGSPVLRDVAAGLTSKDSVQRYHVSRAWVDALKRRQRETGDPYPSPRKQTRWRAPILHAQTAQLDGLIQEQPDRTLAELKARLHTPASWPTLCRAVRVLGYRIKRDGAGDRTRPR
jgi:hypothetical protein